MIDKDDPFWEYNEYCKEQEELKKKLGRESMLMDIEQAQNLEEIAKLKRENEDLYKILWFMCDKLKDYTIKEREEKKNNEESQT